MNRPLALTKLGLGGHSYIAQLGNDPEASFEEQCGIVADCLDAGIRLFDTTYYQERVALGRVMQKLGRRTEATITAWNFFRQLGHDHELVKNTPYEPGSLDRILSELQADRVDLLVIHTRGERDDLGRELELAAEWINEGRIGAVGLGMAKLEDLEWLPSDHPVTHVLHPYNAFNPAAEAMFREARSRGMATIAMSPFVRGWKLDELADATGEPRSQLAELLIRWLVGQDLIDSTIVSIRKREWVSVNAAAAQKGPLTDGEQKQLDDWLLRL